MDQEGHFSRKMPFGMEPVRRFHCPALSSPHRASNDACIVAYIAVNFCCESAVKTCRIAKVIFCDAHRTSEIACFGPI